MAHTVAESPEAVQAYWLPDKMVRLEAAQARAAALAPTVVGMTPSDAQDIVGKDPDLTLEVGVPGFGPLPARERFGCITVLVEERTHRSR